MNPSLSSQPVAAHLNQPTFYVGVGASAGGLEALEAFFTHMPADSGMAFIVIQHLSPDYKSMMVELLSKRTEMPVRRAEEGMVAEANAVYLIPPKKNLSIFHGKLLLSDSDHAKGINLPIDVFLRSLADDQAEKAIGIILSGTGSDGVRGIRALKEAGGMVMVQSEESAKFDGMPRAAISTGLADFIMSPEEMPQKLLAIARHPYAVKTDHPPALLSDEDGLTRIFALLRERTRVDFTFYKPTTVIRRIERRMTFNQLTDLRDYVHYMENYPGEVMTLYRELLIGVTSFFRDREVFDELEHNYLPLIFSQAEKRELRFWVAGCSTGEEAYTLAILCREVMEQMETRLDVKIFATDIDRDAIAAASTGLYPESVAADISPRILAKYFHRKEEHYQIERSIREMVVFAQHNLIKDPPFTNISLASCRNLLIYLQPVLQHKVLELFNFSLAPNGVLLLGSSETTGETAELFEPLHQRFKIYRCKGKRRPLVDGKEFTSFPEPRQGIARTRPGASQVLRIQEEERILDRFLHSLAGEYFPLAVIVNEQMEALHIFGDAEGYFKLPTGKMTSDITKIAVKDLSIPLSTGLQKTFKTGEEMKYTNIRLAGPERTRLAQMRIRLLPGRRGQEPLAAVFIQEITTQTPHEATASAGHVYDISEEAEQRIRDLEQELQFTRENLQATIEELETSNEELQATNEELLASNEELQSTNEELQSVNEELHTVNSEYQNKIIELTELNNDLDNLMAVTRIGTLFLDENLDIRRFTPDVTRIFRLLESDIGRPIHHINHLLRNIHLMELIHQVERTAKEYEVDVQVENGSWFLMRIMPYLIGTQVISGIVLTFIDITQLKKAQSALQGSESRLSTLYCAAPVGIGLLVDRVFVEVNDKMCEMLGYSPSELIGKSARIIYPSEQEYERVGRDKYAQIKLQGTGTVRTHWQRKDGSLLPILLSSSVLIPGDLSQGVMFTAMDLTEVQKADERAQASEERFRRLFETMAEGVVYHNARGEITAANPAAQRILGLTLDQMAGRTPMDPRWRSIHEDGSDFPGEEHPAAVALRSGKAVQGVAMGVFNPQMEQIRWIRVNAMPLFEPDGVYPFEVYATFNDITDAFNAARNPAL
jgi:two-component system CheB/CheR fusion protein